MKAKKIALLNINLGKVLEVAEKGLKALLITSEKRLERGLGKKPKRTPAQKYLDTKEKQQKRELKRIAIEQDSNLQAIESVSSRSVKLTERLSELETNIKDKQADLDIDIEH